MVQRVKIFKKNIERGILLEGNKELSKNKWNFIRIFLNINVDQKSYSQIHSYKIINEEEILLWFVNWLKYFHVYLPDELNLTCMNIINKKIY